MPKIPIAWSTAALTLVSLNAFAGTTRHVGPGQSYLTIQSAVDASSSGDEIAIDPGTYTENVSVNGKSNLVIRGSGVSNTTVSGHITVGVGGYTITTNGVTLQDFRLAYTSGLIEGIHVGSLYNNVSNINLKNLAIDHVGWCAVMASYTGNLVVDGVVVSDLTPASGYSIGLSATSSSVRVLNSTFTGALTSGISLSSSANALIDHCTTNSIGGGIQVDGSSSLQVLRTSMNGGTFGIKLTGCAGSFLQFNTVQNPAGDGISLYNSSNTKVLDNSVTGTAASKYAVVISTSGGVTVNNNRLSGNAQGIHIVSAGTPSPTGIQIHKNDIYSTTGMFIVADASTAPQIDATNNWWGTTSGSTIASKVSFPGSVVSYQPYLNASVAMGTVGSSDFSYGLWNWDQTILGDYERIHGLVQYCLNLGIKNLAFSINWNQPFGENPNNIAAVEEMLSRFHANGIKVELLIGDGAWIYHPDIGPLQGQAEGGNAYDFGRKMIERFVEYQNARYVANPAKCFDGIRLDIEPHGLRTQVTNSMLLDPLDPRRAAGGPNAVAISGYPDEPLLFIQWDPTFNNGSDTTTGLPLPPGSFVDSPVSVRNEILVRFWRALKKYKQQLQGDRGAGHITHNPVAVAQFLKMSTDQVPWYWTVGVQDSDGNHISPETPAMVDDDDNPSTPAIEVWKAAFAIPDEVALMGYRDRYEHYLPDGTLYWFRSLKQWNEGNGPLGYRGALPYLNSIFKPTWIGLESIVEEQLGFNSQNVTFHNDPYLQMKETISSVSSDLKSLYPNAVKGIRYHEYYESLPGKSADEGQFFDTFSTWTEKEISARGNLADWQTFHRVTSTTPSLPGLNTPPAVPNPEALSLSVTGGTGGFYPGPGLTGYIKATINGLPAHSAGDFYVETFVKVLGDTHYFQGGHGYPAAIGNLAPTDNGKLDASGYFHAAPLRIGDITAAKIVWWVDLFNSNGHFIRRFTLDPIDHCSNDNPSIPGCVSDDDIQVDRFYNPNDVTNIDVRGILPTPMNLTFNNVTISGNIRKSTGADTGAISGTITGWPSGVSPADFHVRTWVEYAHAGSDPVANTNPNWQSEVNVWNLLSQDVPLNAQGQFTAVNQRPINPTGDSQAYSDSNGTYKLWITVHDNTSDGITRIGCPDGLNGIKPAAARFLDMDYSLVSTYEVGMGSAGIDLNVNMVSVDHSSGIISGNAKGLTAGKTYKAYVWAEWYDVDRNIWQERAEPIASNTVEIGKGGYFQIPVTLVIPSVLAAKGVTNATPRNIWVSIHDRALNLNEFPIISNWTCSGNNPYVNQSGAYPLWLGRYFHMDSSFDYYEGFRPAAQTATRDISTPTAAPTGLVATALDASTIRLTWNDTSVNEIGFKVEQQTGSGSFVEVAKVCGKESSGSIISWTCTNLNPTTPYTYRVRAFNLDGSLVDVNSAYSSTASATTPASGPPSLLSGSVSWYCNGAYGWVKGTMINLPAGGPYRIHTWSKPANDPYYYHQGRAENVQNAVQFSTDDGASTNNGLWGGDDIYITLHYANLDTIGATEHPTCTSYQQLTSLPGIITVFQHVNQ